MAVNDHTTGVSKKRHIEDDDEKLKKEATKRTRTLMASQQYSENGNCSDENNDWRCGFLEGSALFAANNVYSRLHNYDDYKKQIVASEILKSINFSGKVHCYANIHHDGVACNICESYPSVETIRRAKSR